MPNARMDGFPNYRKASLLKRYLKLKLYKTKRKQFDLCTQTILLKDELIYFSIFQKAAEISQKK